MEHRYCVFCTASLVSDRRSREREMPVTGAGNGVSLVLGSGNEVGVWVESHVVAGGSLMANGHRKWPHLCDVDSAERTGIIPGSFPRRGNSVASSLGARETRPSFVPHPRPPLHAR